MTSPNPLEVFFEKNQDRRIHKWMHYFEIYHRHFDRFRGKSPVILEFGVSQGGSLRMWRDYFGKGAVIHGVDINPRCKELEERRTTVHIGDQEDRDFLRSVVAEIGRPIDVVIEDGGHTYKQQIHTFEEVYPHMAEDGCFLIEDLHTSYWKKYGGAPKKAGTFVEYAKDLSDQLNAWHSRDLEVDEFTRTTRSMHFYDSIIVFERGTVEKPTHRMTGHATVEDPDWRPGRAARVKQAVRARLG